MKAIFCWASSVCWLLPLACLAHTPAETNELTRSLCDDLLVMDGDDVKETDQIPPNYISPHDWFGGTDAEGWTANEKADLLIDFVSRMLMENAWRTNQTVSLQVKFAIGGFGLMRLTNAIPTLQTALDNSHRALRPDALGALIRIWGPSTNSTALIKSIVTNRLAYTKHERGEAYYDYLYRFLRPSKPNVLPYADEAASRIAVAYAFRADATNDASATFPVDNYLVSYLPGYTNSLERLTNVIQVLSRPDCTQPDVKYFGPIRTALETLPVAQRTVVPNP